MNFIDEFNYNELLCKDERLCSDEIFKKLVTKGYFPTEITPCFNTIQLGYISDKLKEIIDSIDCGPSKCINYSIPKGRFARRALKIPNPINQIKLISEICNNWDDIYGYISKSNISLTIPKTNFNSDRALAKSYSFRDISKKIIENSIGSRYMLKIDISRYYQTIYTHSIPWALHTKEVAKKNRKDSLLGNRLDKLVRNCQDTQTIGIPTGPDTSLIISEIIGASIDLALESNVKFNDGFRYIDDYYLFFSSLSEAEKGLAEFQKIIAIYELELNINKTKTIQLPTIIEPVWVSELSSVPYQEAGIISYINKSYNLFNQYPNDEVLKYSLNMISKSIKSYISIVSNNHRGIIEKYIYNLITYDASSIPLAIEVLLSYEQKGHRLNMEDLTKTVNASLEYHIRNLNEFEICWLLWICKVLKLRVPNNIALSLSTVENSLVALSVLDLERIDLIEGYIDKSLWKSLINEESLGNENWLLAYECVVKGYFEDISSEFIDRYEFWKLLKENNISFYDTSASTNWLNRTKSECWFRGGVSSAT